MNPWEQEYRNNKLVTLDTEPIAAFRDFLRFLKKQGFDFENKQVLDIGTGTGRHLFALIDRGANGIGIDISETALGMARDRAIKEFPQAIFQKHDIREPLPFPDTQFDICIDATTSNALNLEDFKNYLKEVHRVLKPEGYFFLRGLLLDGDANAKQLIKQFPAGELMYRMPQTGIIERVLRKDQMKDLFEPYFKVVNEETMDHFSQIEGRSYKRRFIVLYFQKA